MKSQKLQKCDQTLQQKNCETIIGAFMFLGRPLADLRYDEVFSEILAIMREKRSKWFQFSQISLT